MSAIGFAVGGLVIRGIHGHRFCIFPRWMGLPPVPFSVGWHWDNGPLQDQQLGPHTVDLL